MTGVASPADPRLGLDSYSLALTMEDPTRPRDVSWFLDRVDELGLDGCQLDPRHLGNWDPAVVRRTGDACRDRGFYLELGTWRFDPDTVGRRLELCREAGAPSLRTFYGGLRHAMSAAEIRAAVDESVAGLDRLAPVAERVGVVLALENHEEFTSAEILEILERVGSPHVRACLDTGNAMMVGEDPVDCVRALLPVAACLHIKDWVVHTGPDGVRAWEDRVVGDGDARCAEVIALIRDQRPDLPLTLENPTRGSRRPVTPADEERNVRESVRRVREILARRVGSPGDRPTGSASYGR